MGQPQQGLGDGQIALHFQVSWVGFEFFPKIEIFLIAKFGEPENQAGLAHRPAIPMGHIRPITIGQPAVFIREIGINKIHRHTRCPTIGQLELPEVLIGRGQQLT